MEEQAGRARPYARLTCLSPRDLPLSVAPLVLEEEVLARLGCRHEHLRGKILWG